MMDALRRVVREILKECVRRPSRCASHDALRLLLPTHCGSDVFRFICFQKIKPMLLNIFKRGPLLTNAKKRLKQHANIGPTTARSRTNEKHGIKAKKTRDRRTKARQNLARNTRCFQR